MGTAVDDAAAAEFHDFFERHHAELARFAHLMTGEADAADDLAADALVAVWHRWDRVRAAEHPLAYARGIVANPARTRIRGAVREQRRIALFWSHRESRADAPDVAGVVDVQDALRRLPFRKRACVVLRHHGFRPGQDRSRAGPGQAGAGRGSGSSGSPHREVLPSIEHRSHKGPRTPISPPDSANRR